MAHTDLKDPRGRLLLSLRRVGEHVALLRLGQRRPLDTKRQLVRADTPSLNITSNSKLAHRLILAQRPPVKRRYPPTKNRPARGKTQVPGGRTLDWGASFSNAQAT